MVHGTARYRGKSRYTSMHSAHCRNTAYPRYDSNIILASGGRYQENQRSAVHRDATGCPRGFIAFPHEHPAEAETAAPYISAPLSQNPSPPVLRVHGQAVLIGRCKVGREDSISLGRRREGLFISGKQMFARPNVTGSNTREPRRWRKGAISEFPVRKPGRQSRLA